MIAVQRHRVSFSPFAIGRLRRVVQAGASESGFMDVIDW